MPSDALSSTLAAPTEAGPVAVGEPADAQVRAVVRSARIIKAFGDGRPEIGVSELARALGLSPTTVHRILSTLTAEGLLEQNPTAKKYRLGPELTVVGLVALSQWPFGPACRAVMEGLATSTGETVSIGVLRGTEVTYVQQVESRQALRAVREVGMNIPLYCTAQGKILLASAPPDHQAQLLRAVQLERFTPSTITDKADLHRALNTVRERGYAISDEEYVPGLRGIAVPIRNYSGAVTAGLSVMGPSVRLSLYRMESFLPALRADAERLSRQLGWRPERQAGDRGT